MSWTDARRPPYRGYGYVPLRSAEVRGGGGGGDVARRMGTQELLCVFIFQIILIFDFFSF